MLVLTKQITRSELPYLDEVILGVKVPVAGLPVGPDPVAVRLVDVGLLLDLRLAQPLGEHVSSRGAALAAVSGVGVVRAVRAVGAEGVEEGALAVVGGGGVLARLVVRLVMRLMVSERGEEV